MADSGPGRVKICGLCRTGDVRRADEAGADYLGSVLSGGFRRSVEPSRIPGLMEGVRGVPVAVLVDEEPDAAARLARVLGAGVVQLHGHESPGVVRAVAEAGPWKVWKAVRLRQAGDLDAALDRYGDLVDGILVEGWKEGVVGGAGVRLDDEVAAVAGARIPDGVAFVLAGGLTAATVFDVVARFAPDVVDVSSGVEESLGRKDPEKVRRFVEEARRAWTDASLSRTSHHPGASP